MNNVCDCKAKYSIEPCHDAYVLYYGRCKHRRGYNLITMIDPACNFEPRHIERLINAGAECYQRNPTHAYEAE